MVTGPHEGCSFHIDSEQALLGQGPGVALPVGAFLLAFSLAGRFPELPWA